MNILMHYKPKIVAILVILLGLSLTFSINGSSAQTNPPHGQLAINITDSQIAFYDVNSTGQFTVLNTITDFRVRNLADRIRADWEVMLPLEFVPSPDGNHVAFTATHWDGTIALFLYTRGNSIIHQKPISGIASILWSSDSASLLLVYPRVRTDFYPKIEDIYQYTLATDDLTPLTNSPEVFESQVLWLPDNDQLIYRSDDSLYVLDVATQQTSLIVDIDVQLPLDVDLAPLAACDPISLQWLTDANRLYYVVSCNQREYEFLYSSTLQPDNTLELDLQAFYPEEQLLKIIGVNRTSAGVVLAISSGVNFHTDDPYGFWQLIELSSSGQHTVIATEDSYFDDTVPSLYSSNLASDEDHLAIGGFAEGSGYLGIINLTTSQITNYEADGHVCELLWLDNNTLQFDTQSGTCYGGTLATSATWMLDLTTGQISSLNGDLDGITWILDRPDVEPTNFSPSADAGQDQPNAQTNVTLDGSSSSDSDGTVVAYQWREDGTLIAEGINPQVNLTEGEHTIILTVVDDDGAIDRDTVIVTVEGASCDFTIVASDTATLIATITTANGSGNPTTMCLAPDSTYTFTAINNNLNALPRITGDITIEGQNATITRSGATNFRFFEVEPGANFTLNNLMLSNGDVGDERGGAILNDGDLTINSVIFDGNSATSGGAIDSESGSATITDSTFTDNTGVYGGAIDNDDTAIMTITGSTFTNNHALADAGAIHNDGATLTVSDTTFTTNTADDYAGAIDNDDGELTINASIFTSNSSDGGGAIRNDGTLTINAGSVFTTNSAVNLGWGGAIYNKSDSTLVINASSFNGNIANLEGGAIRNSGTLTVNSGSSFDGNIAAQYGGAIYNTSATATLSGVQITNNTATAYDAGGVYGNSSTSITITDSTISGNDSGRRGGGIWSSGTTSLTNVYLTNNTAVVEGGGIYGSSSATISAGNSCISGNSSRAAYSASSANQNFENNWWGATDGPSGSGSGGGDAVNSKIDFTPFINTSCPLP